MSKTQTPEKKPRKTRMTGTAALRPCVQCKELKPRFTAYKPRWAGCVAHKTERGRRIFEPGCADCKAIADGNIRQPRCIDCDKTRSKKRNVVTPSVTPTPIKAEVPVVAAATIEVPAVVDLPAEPEPEPEPEAVTVEPQSEASDESVEVTPPPVAAPKARPKIASMDDLSKLFGDL